LSEPSQPQVVLITGTSRGVGQNLAVHFSRRGDRVIGCSRQSIQLDLPNYKHFALDVTDETAVRQMIQAVGKQHGQLDILINNAGTASMNHVLLMPTETARKVLEVNMLGVFVLCREAARLMQKNRYGRIINIGSVAVQLKIEGEAMYAASKSAVVSFTEIVAKELAPFGITCNVVSLSPVQTDLIRGVPEEKIGKILDRLVIKRLASFEDITNVVDFFASRASGFVTGQTLCLGGA